MLTSVRRWSLCPWSERSCRFQSRQVGGDGGADGGDSNLGVHSPNEASQKQQVAHHERSVVSDTPLQ